MGENGFGTVIFKPRQTTSCADSDGNTDITSGGVLYTFAIQGDDMYLCRGNMTSATTCSDGPVAAKFKKA